MRQLLMLASLFAFINSGYGQKYETHSQGSNNNAGGHYVAPVVIKTYGSSSEGYHPAERTSYNFYTSKPAGSSSISSNKKDGSSSNYEAPVKRAGPKGAVIKGPNGKFGIAEEGGKTITEAQYDAAGDYSELQEGMGYFWVKKGGKYGIVWPYNAVPVVPVIYDEIKKINNSRAMVKLGGKMGVVEMNLTTEKSEIAIPVKYDDMGPLAGNTWVKQGDKLGWINSLNDIIIPVQYQEINEFGLKAFIVKKNNKIGLMNGAGKVILPLEYDEIGAVSNGASWMKQNNKWGLLNLKGEVVAAPIYDTVYEQAGGKVWLNDLAVVSKKGQLIYINNAGVENTYSTETASAAANVAANKLEENFDETNGKYKWPANPDVKIAAGQLTFTPKSRKDMTEFAEIPREFSFQKNDDWVFEVTMEKVAGNPYITTWGIDFGGEDASDAGISISPDMAFITGVGIGHKDVRTKKGMNALKIVKTGDKIDVFYNTKLVGSGKADKVNAGGFKFEASTPSSTGNFVVISFDNIKFEITKKGG